jgi:hypothetical protein
MGQGQGRQIQPALPENPAPENRERRPRIERPFPHYAHIPYPSFSMVELAAYIWDGIAESEDLEYAFSGSFVASLNGGRFQVHDIEIVMDPSVWQTDRLTDIMYRHSQCLTVTSTNRNIVIVPNTNLGIALRFSETGTSQYPDPLIPPPDSHRRTSAHANSPTGTYHHQVLPSFNKPVPVLRFHLLLKQRLERFEPDSRDREVQLRNNLEAEDIKVFLRCAAIHGDPPFSTADSSRLSYKARRWLQYSRSPLALQELQWWRNLNIELNEAGVAQFPVQYVLFQY